MGDESDSSMVVPGITPRNFKMEQREKYELSVGLGFVPNTR